MNDSQQIAKIFKITAQGKSPMRAANCLHCDFKINYMFGSSGNVREKMLKHIYENHNEIIFPIDEKQLFFQEKTMPCCGNSPISYHKGPCAGVSMNIKCGYCGVKWNMCAPFFLERIPS